jgi:toxin YoeB
MGKFTIQVEKLAQDHLNKHIKSGDKASIKKIEKIFVELSQKPY